MSLWNMSITKMNVSEGEDTLGARNPFGKSTKQDQIY